MAAEISEGLDTVCMPRNGYPFTLDTMISYVYVSPFCRKFSLLQCCFSQWVMHIHGLSIHKANWNPSLGITLVGMSGLTQNRQEKVNFLRYKIYRKPLHIYDHFLTLHQLIFFLCCVFLTTGVRHTLGLTAAEATPSIPSRVPEEMLNRWQELFLFLIRDAESWSLIPCFFLFLNSRVSPSQEI